MWIDDVLEGMRKHFVTNAAIQGQISERLYEVAAEEWILALPTTQEERSPRTGQWASYQIIGVPDSRNLDGESAYQKLNLLMSFYGPTPAVARVLFGLFHDALVGPGGATDKNNYHGTWKGKKVRCVRFQLEGLTSDFSETFRQAEVTCPLVIPIHNTK